MVVPVLLFVVAILARLVVAALFVEPAYPDAYYYANLARELAAGHGFQIDYIWNFVEVGGRLPAEGVLPIPLERPLDAAGGPRPGALHLAPGADGDGVCACPSGWPPRRSPR